MNHPEYKHYQADVRVLVVVHADGFVEVCSMGTHVKVLHCPVYNPSSPEDQEAAETRMVDRLGMAWKAAWDYGRRHYGHSMSCPGPCDKMIEVT